MDAQNIDLRQGKSFWLAEPLVFNHTTDTQTRAISQCGESPRLDDRTKGARAFI